MLEVMDAMTRELSGQPFMPVNVDLDAKRKPRLNLDMDEAELSVEEVIVEEQALAFGRTLPASLSLFAGGPAMRRLAAKPATIT